MDTGERRLRMFSVQYRTQASNLSKSVAQELINYAAVLNLELGLVRSLGSTHTKITPLRCHITKVAWCNDLLLIV
jgi:hypothetical protein